MPIAIVDITAAERDKILALRESHFCDLKGIAIQPAKLTRTISALSNAEGGEVYIGLDEDKETRQNTWNGFNVPEDANGHLQAFEPLFPLGDGYAYSFLRSAGMRGLLLRVEVSKSRDVKVASNREVFVRRGAQNLPVNTPEALTRLKRNKGLVSFETEPVGVDASIITNSIVTLEFMLGVVPTAEPEPWLRKQLVIQAEKPTVAGIVLFAEEPQAALPKRTGIKIYRYKTTAQEGSRDTLDGDPRSIEGHAYAQISAAVAATVQIIESVRVNTPGGLNPLGIQSELYMKSSQTPYCTATTVSQTISTSEFSTTASRWLAQVLCPATSLLRTF
jgi:ATP-dependent DNA helicase RecG